jgi:hypothetical protein
MNMSLAIQTSSTAKAQRAHTGQVKSGRRRPDPQGRADNRINKSGNNLIDRSEKTTSDTYLQERKIVDQQLLDGLNQLKLQNAVDKIKEFVTSISNLMKSAHETMMSVINNLR